MDANSIREHIQQVRDRSATASATGIEELLREARQILKDAFGTDAENDARQLFRELRAKRDAGNNDNGELDLNTRREQIARRIESERMRLHGSGTLSDMELAVNGLFAVLQDLGPTPKDSDTDDSAAQADWRFRHRVMRSDVLETLAVAAAKHPQLRRKVLELLDGPDVAQTDDILALLDRLDAARGTTPTPDAADAPADDGAVVTEDAPVAAPPPAPDVAQMDVQPAAEDGSLKALLAAANHKYYAGDYYEAIDAYTDVLRRYPDNAEAADRLAKTEDNIRRGVVPDRRVPFEARAAFGRAQSLERAGRYEEARNAYREALQEARKAGPLLENWYPAVEALTRVETSIVAQETRQEGDRLLAQDRWEEAIQKYDAVLQLLPDDAHARERRDAVSKLLAQIDDTQERFAAMTHNPGEAGQAAVALMQTLRRMRSRLGSGERFDQVEADLHSQTTLLHERLVKRIRQLLAQASEAETMGERKRLVDEAVGLLEQTLEISPEDDDVFEMLQAARMRQSELDQGNSALNEVRGLINAGAESHLYQARELLMANARFRETPEYRQAAASLRRQYVLRAQDAAEEDRHTAAMQLLTAAEKPPFTVLGKSDEVTQARRDVQGARRRQALLRVATIGGGSIVVIGLIAALVLFMPRILAATLPSDPTPTPTIVRELPSATQAPTSTAAPSATLEASPTATVVPSDTPFPTVAFTPTPMPRIGAVNVDTAARLEPDPLAPWAFTLRQSDPVQVLDEVYDNDGRLWYRILYVRGDSQLIGWAQAQEINVQPTLAP